MKLIILDRDGVINHDSDNYIRSPDEWKAYPESIHAIGRLSRRGYTIAVATNQSGIGRGYYSVETLNLIHETLHSLVEKQGGKISRILYCPHTPDEGCDCRKPKPGLLLRLGELLHIPLGGAAFVGDSLTDLEAAERAGMNPVLVRTGKGMKTQSQGGLPEGTLVYDSLSHYVDLLCRQ